MPQRSPEMNALTVLPAEILAAVETVIAQHGLDLTNEDAVRGRCQDMSYDLARALRSLGYDANGATIDLSAELGDHEYALHTVCRTEDENGARYDIDLTAAQYPELG